MKYLSIVLGVFLQAGGQPINIPIQNASFESSVPSFGPTACGPYYPYRIPNWYVSSQWNSSSGFGIVKPSPNCTIPPDGVQILNLQEVSISQNLGDGPGTNGAYGTDSSDGVYTLSFYVSDAYGYYPGNFTVSLSVNPPPPAPPGGAQGLPLCSMSGRGGEYFTKITMLCPSYRVFGQLVLTIKAVGYPLFFDNVSLTFTPTN